MITSYLQCTWADIGLKKTELSLALSQFITLHVGSRRGRGGQQRAPPRLQYSDLKIDDWHEGTVVCLTISSTGLQSGNMCSGQSVTEVVQRLMTSDQGVLLSDK